MTTANSNSLLPYYRILSSGPRPVLLIGEKLGPGRSAYSRLRFWVYMSNYLVGMLY